ncbi:MAG: hypothetical protein IPO01_14230 [Chitinophagaceae bacterium]|nr:hypothetical protein [Chitinophagaceae bacterium]
MAKPPSELKAVLVKLSVALPPVPPSKPPTRFNIARRCSQVHIHITYPCMVNVHVHLDLVIVALAGTPATVRFVVAAAPVPSGIGTLIVPELAVTLPGTGGAPQLPIRLYH